MDANGAVPAKLPITIDLGIHRKGGDLAAAGYLFRIVLAPASRTSGWGNFTLTFTTVAAATRICRT